MTDWSAQTSRTFFKILCLKRKKFWGSSSSYGPQSKGSQNGISLSSTSKTDTNTSSTLSLSNCTTLDKNGRRSRGSSIMAPPPSTTSSSGLPTAHVTEDTPPDLLEGTMELLVILPSTSTVRMTVDRRAPMMDLLIQVGTVNKLNPGDHIVQVRNDRGFEMPYKPSTPIGALDTSTIEIVPKNRVSDYIIVKKPSRLANQPFEHTFRLQIHLPRNQLYVMRVSMKTVLEDILKEVCLEKNLDIHKYEIRHPGNVDERLPLNSTLGMVGVHEITIVSKNTKLSNSVSAADIIALQQTDGGRGKGYLDSSFKHSRSSVGDSSVSSGSTGSARGLSPTRSDDSRSASPFSLHSPVKHSHRPNSGSSTDVNRPAPTTSVHKAMSMSNMFSPGTGSALGAGVQPPPRQKKRAAPLPPPLLKSLTVSSMCTTNTIDEKQDGTSRGMVTPKKKEAPRAPGLTKSPLTSSATQLNQSVHHRISNHSRHSSGSSAGYNEGVSGLTQNELHHRYEYDRQSSAPAMLSRQTTARSASNLTTTSSISNTSLASSSGGSKKRRAPVPPTLPPLKPQSEIDEEDYSEISSTISGPGSGIGVPASPKLDKSGQSSVEVEVDVHYIKNSTDEPISVNTSKDEDPYSHTPVSSLSSPGSYLSNSSASSPLPPADNTTESTSELKPNSAPSPQSNFCTGTGELDNMQSTEDPQAPTPLPPPRKTREVAVEPEEEFALQKPQPKPRAKPRTDRKSSDSSVPALNLTSKQSLTSVSSEEKADPDLESVSPQPILSTTQLRNPLAKYGIKVLPDNVLKERADRLAKVASSSLEQQHVNESGHDGPLSTTSPDGGSSLLNKKTSAPPPPPTSTPQVPLPPSSKNSAFQLRARDSDTSTESSNQKDPKIYKSTVPKSQKSFNSDEDSDNLEENLELFELESKPIPRNVMSIGSPKITLVVDSQTNKPQKSKAPPVPTTPIPTPTELKPPANSARGASSSVSDFQVMRGESEPGLVRTNSDRLNNSKNDAKLYSSEDGKLLNRWQNLESLNEFNDSSHANNRNTTNKLSSVKVEGARNTSSTKLSHATSKNLSSDDFEATRHSVDNNEDADDVGSSESEVSYTDSGLPTTETITPSPMDFDARISDHEDEDGESPIKEQPLESRGSSNRSSFQSDDGDQWRNVLEEKAQNSQQAREKAFASMLPQSLDHGETKKKIKSDPHESSDYKNNANSSTDEDATQDNRRSSSESTSSRKLSKSESFSEFDFIQMKRKHFAGARNRQTTHHSSSEDLRFTEFQQLDQSSKTDDEPAEKSMQNLKNSNDSVKRRESENKTERSLQKTTSLHEIQNLNSDISQDPEVMKSFHSQLEAQFEQWKSDFLKTHVEPGTTARDLNLPTQSNLEKAELSIEIRDTRNVHKDPNNQIYIASEEKNVPIVETVHQVSSPPETAYTLRSMASVRSDEQRSVEKSTPQVEYRYTGPPTVNMGSWTERPKSTVSVKKDEDYIMGFGQANPKVAPAEPRSPIAKVPKSSTVTQGTITQQKSNPQIISPTFRSVVDSVSPTKTVTPSPNKGLSATLNARPVSSIDSTDSVSTIKSVLSSWKQRVENNDDQNKGVPQGHPPEIDIYENEANTFTRSSNQKLKNLPEEPNDSVKNVSNDRKLMIVDLGANVNITVSKDKFDQPSKSIDPGRTVVIPREPNTPKKPPVEESVPVKIEDTSEHRAKPMFKISSMESKPNRFAQIHQSRESEPTIAQIQPQTSIESVVLRKSQISLDISYPKNENGPSLNDRKRYFQGVSPVESPNRETPLPAVNMKNSIVTVQNVLGQRQQSNDSSQSPTLTLQRSGTIPKKIDTESEPKVNTTYPTQKMSRPFSMMSSAEMVQRVLGKSSKPAFEAFRRSPSPISSTTSTLSRTSSGRDTPLSSDGLESSVRITNEIKKPAPNNIKHVGNKSVIIVQGASEPAFDSSSKPKAGSVSSNVLKLQNSINLGVCGGPKKVPFGESTTAKSNNSVSTTTIVINGNAEQPSVKERQESWNSGKSTSVGEGAVVGPPISAQVPPPPPPPPNQDMKFMRPKHISLIGRPKSETFSSSSPSSKPSTPTSPNSDPRSEIFSAIKSSNGNFGLRKTAGSTFLLK